MDMNILLDIIGEVILPVSGIIVLYLFFKTLYDEMERHIDELETENDYLKEFNDCLLHILKDYEGDNNE